MFKTKKMQVILIIVVALALLLSVIILSKKWFNKTNDPKGVVLMSNFYDKYEMISCVDSLKEEGQEVDLFVVSGFKNIKRYELEVSGLLTVYSDDYYMDMYPHRSESSLTYLIKHAKETREVEGITYYITSNIGVFYVKDGYCYEVKSLSEDFDLNRYLSNVSITKYEYVSDDTVRANESRNEATDISINGIERELSYKYHEINYKECFEYDVYTDGKNDYMLDNNKKLIGYRIGESEAKSELAEFIDLDKYKLELEDKDKNEYIYFKYSGDYKIGSAKVLLDAQDMVKELLVNDLVIDKEIPKINEKLLKKKINERLEKIHVKYTFTQELDEIEDMSYSINDIDELVLVCNVKAKVVKAFKSDYKIKSEDFYITLIFDVNDLV